MLVFIYRNSKEKDGPTGDGTAQGLGTSVVVGTSLGAGKFLAVKDGRQSSSIR